MKTLLKIVCGIVIILLLNFLINLIFVSKNNGKKYIEEYKKASKELKVKVNPVFFEGRNTQDSYFKGTVFFKGLYGGYSGKIIKDDYSERYFKIIRFDPYGDKFYLAQSAKIDNKELIVKVDPLQYNDKTFGTKENPILVFWYEGANEKLMTDIRTDEKDKDGFYINKDVQLSPTEEEYRYNVTQYLTYVMPKEEFKKRFEN